MIEDGILAYMEEKAVKAYPAECCGILYGMDRDGEPVVCGVLALENHEAGEQIRVSYDTDPLELFEKEKRIAAEGYEILGFYHSHPDKPAVASDKDDRQMLPGLIYLIMSVSSVRVTDIRIWIKKGPDKEPKELAVKRQKG